MSIVLYDVWWASVGFEDKPGSKIRPVIIYRINNDETYTVIPITTHVPRDEPGEYSIKYYDEIKLPKLHSFDIICINSIMEKISFSYE